MLQVKTLAPETPEIGRLLQEAKVALAKSKRIDYYKILGIPSSASPEDIKKAYKKMALKLREQHLSFHKSLGATVQMQCCDSAHYHIHTAQ